MILLAAMAWLVAGCSVSGDEYDKRLQAALPKEELAQAEQVLALLNSKDFDAIKKQMDPRFIGANFDQDIQRVGAMLPDEKPILTKTIGSRTNTFNGTLSQYTLSFEQQFSKSWLLTAVQLQKGRSSASTSNPKRNHWRPKMSSPSRARERCIT